MDRGAWRATVDKDTKSQTQVKQMSMNTSGKNTQKNYKKEIAKTRMPAMVWLITYRQSSCSLQKHNYEQS